jgi:hypothetical protein
MQYGDCTTLWSPMLYVWSILFTFILWLWVNLLGKLNQYPPSVQVTKENKRIISGVGSKSSCRGLCRKFNILPVVCQYILSLMLFTVDNQNNFQTNLNIHAINTGNKNQLHFPSASLSCLQKGVFYSGIRIFNSLPDNIRNLRNDKVQFKKELQKYLVTHSLFNYRILRTK